MDGASRLVHASCIALDGHAALIRGPSGAGKSDLALRCVSERHAIGAREISALLVADDQVLLERQGNDVAARSPPSIHGRIEVRGLGIIEMPAALQARVRLIVDLADADEIERFPDPRPATELLGVILPVLRVAPFHASASLKVLLALTSEPSP